LCAAIQRNPRAEVAFMLIARATWQPDPKLLGLAYCRRSWCDRLIVDFVAVHPHIVGRLRENIRGMGTGLFNGLIQIADHLGIEIIWGEATANSAPFYERILGAKPVLDQFHLEGEAMAHCRRELARIHQPRLESTEEMKDTDAMKTKRRLRTREELLALEDKYFPGTLGNLLSLGAAHFRPSNRKNRRRAHRNGVAHRRKAVTA